MYRLDSDIQWVSDDMIGNTTNFILYNILMNHLLNNTMTLYSITFSVVDWVETKVRTSLGSYKCRRSRINARQWFSQIGKEVEVVQWDMWLYTIDAPIKKNHEVDIDWIWTYKIQSDPHPHTWYGWVIHHRYSVLLRLV